MAGKPPEYRVTAKEKNAPGGERPLMLEIGALWQSQYGYNMTLANGVKIVMSDGTEVTGATFFLNCNKPRDRSQLPGGGGGQRPQPGGERLSQVNDFEPRPTDDIPF